MSKQIRFSKALDEVMHNAVNYAVKLRNEFVTPEHLLFSLCSIKEFAYALESANSSAKTLAKHLSNYIKSLERVPEDIDYEITHSHVFEILMRNIFQEAMNAQVNVISTAHVVNGFFNTNDCFANELLTDLITDDGSIDTDEAQADFIWTIIDYCHQMNINDDDIQLERQKNFEDEGSLPFGNDTNEFYDEYDEDYPLEQHSATDTWKSFATCINDITHNHNPLIGRDEEIDRTIQVLCRKDKNNPLHIGDPGVGKSAIIFGLAERLNKGNVPERLKGHKIYQINLSDMLAGTQYRGDFEKRIKMIMKGLESTGNAIVYIDEMHNIIGAGSSGNNSLDAADMLKPYFENSSLRFIGATTFADFKRSLANSRSIMRHFQPIDIVEPSVDNAIKIMCGLKSKYEKFHGVKYPKAVIEFAVKASARYINERALPDKAIDLIDEAGAYLETHPAESNNVTVELVSQILAKMCKVDHISDIDDNAADNEALNTLYERISAKIYGQDSAVRSVVEAVQMSRAGLLDDNKPVASLLFVGPTGVGKTEVARVLAQELGLGLVRFDMSEYAEKHTVAKLIGSPAGYVGYEDGGLLTDAIRRTPNCVLLLDEIEKAHSDIYNLLLQVMDYASLSDNRGQKADFRHVVLIMTSNAGAQHSGKSSVGFTGSTNRGAAMMKAVKATFKPEFLNRLSGTIVFNDLDRTMASLILNKKLNELRSRLSARKITIALDDDATNWMLAKGFTPEYGAREIDRVISQLLKPLLMREILFGKLKKGGNATFTLKPGSDELTLTIRAKQCKTETNTK
ncbi:MAG: AAA family ATPase [Muribaculaceae bacterium]